MPAAQMVGLRCYEAFHPRTRPCPDCPVGRALKSGQAESGLDFNSDGTVFEIRGYPVTDDEGAVVGILTEYDCLKLLAKGADHEVPSCVVSDYMTDNVITVPPHMDIYYAAGLFLANRFRQPVEDSRKQQGQHVIGTRKTDPRTPGTLSRVLEAVRSPSDKTGSPSRGTRLRRERHRLSAGERSRPASDNYPDTGGPLSIALPSQTPLLKPILTCWSQSAFPTTNPITPTRCPNESSSAPVKLS